MMGWVGSGEDLWVGLGWVQRFWVGLGFEKVTHYQLCPALAFLLQQFWPGYRGVDDPVKFSSHLV